MNILDQEQKRKEAGMLPQAGNLILNRSEDILKQPMGKYVKRNFGQKSR